jgi:5-methylcytosine-specific restriction endonuclease McrBC regulatory subunit McrC
MEQDTEILPDITIRSPNRLVVMDAKYKTKYSQTQDLNQIWIYCIALNASLGVLIYPKHELIDSAIPIHTLRENKTQVFIQAIDLQKSNYADFQNECNSFSVKMSELIADKSL